MKDDVISRQKAIDLRLINADALKQEFPQNTDWEYPVNTNEYVCEIIDSQPTIEPERKTGIPKDAVEYILRKETVSTNPYDFTANEKFIKFMDDPEIASFGRWQHANGFNTALVAVKCELDKIPDDEPERKKGKWTKDCACEICGFKPWYERDIHTLSFCPNCGADMRGDQDDFE